MKKIFFAFAIFFFIYNSFSFSQITLSQTDQTRIKSNLEFLASDELQGRNAASQMEKIASKFIAAELMKYGVKPFGEENTYFQNFNVHSFIYEVGSKLILTDENRLSSIELPLGYDCAVFIDFSIDPDVLNKQYDLTFVGYGITAAEFNYDDYYDINVAGKVVITYPGEPFSTDTNYFNGLEPTQHSHFNTKLKNALKHGAAGVLIIPGENLLPVWYVLRKQSLEQKMFTCGVAKPERSTAPPIVVLAPEVSERIFAGEKYNSLQINQTVSSEKSPPVFDLKKKITFEITTEEENSVARNVLGVVEGIDSELKDEYVIIGAHYDHVGMHGEEIYNGADDNGSGTVAVMEIAKRLAEKKANKRSVIVALFTAEEKELNGSAWLSDQFDLSDVAAMVNIDMCGKGCIDSISTVGADISSIQLNDIIADVNKSTTNFTITAMREHLNQADHYPFFIKGIPVVTFSDADETDLHRTTDDTWKINFSKIYRTVDLVENLILRLANDSCKPAFSYKEE